MLLFFCVCDTDALNYFFSCLFVVNTLLTIYAKGPIRFFKRKKVYQILFSVIEGTVSYEISWV